MEGNWTPEDVRILKRQARQIVRMMVKKYNLPSVQTDKAYVFRQRLISRRRK
jgi:hypothetical protein